ncbi:EmrB/QacA subfamily drug resistance transporter [Microbacterium resistens]|uniref:EmrB/QacA subfamily drug resistance transporter n=1 Tax=Microbacterium resistens TaxID=156977 RepID=A0ABU1SEI3_9MICO|nr:MDR family MFS transporter [Microbacterium resistens]MDR6867307.1 EmrB/QacA subfamily drug resistance transporter [Microbacterium resistens]
MTAPAPAPSAMSHRQVLEALSGLLLGMFVSMIAATVVSTSLPVIVHDLGGDQTAFTWVVTSTLLTTAISTPIWGKLADLFNRKLLIQLALVIFVAATAAAGFSQDAGMLITFRAVQGLGAGGLAALSQIIMADIISPRERGRYMGLFGAVMAVATVGGPLLGGFLTDVAGWRWNFYVSIPFAIAALLIIQMTLRIPQKTRKARIDYLGIVLLSTAVSLLLVWVTSAGKDYDWWSIQTILMVGGSLLAAVLFIVVELRVSEPLVPLRMFRDRTFTLSVVASISIGVAMFGTSVFLSQYMQMARGATPTQAGLMTLPMIAGLLGSSIVVGQLITRYGRWKSYIVTGAVLMIVGSALLSTLHYDTNFVLVSVYMFLLGAGVGMSMQNLVLIVQNTARPEDLGAASSGVTFFRSLGGTVGVSVMGSALAATVTGLFTDRKTELATAIASLGEKGAEVGKQLSSGALPEVHNLPEAVRVIVEDIYAQGIASSFLIAVPLAVISLVAVLFLPNKPLTRMTRSERMQASEADLATVSAPQGMDAIPATGPIPTSTRRAVRENRQDG